MKKTLLSGVALTMALTLPTINVDASSKNTNLKSDANVDYQKLQVQESEDTFVFLILFEIWSSIWYIIIRFLHRQTIASLQWQRLAKLWLGQNIKIISGWATQGSLHHGRKLVVTY